MNILLSKTNYLINSRKKMKVQNRNYNKRPKKWHNSNLKKKFIFLTDKKTINWMQQTLPQANKMHYYKNWKDNKTGMRDRWKN